MTDGILSGLAGINSARNVHASHQTTLEKLLDIEHDVVKKYKPARGEHFKVYQEFYPQLKEELSAFPFAEDDLRSLILATSNMECNLVESQMRGMYTGMLLQLLTERNKAQGKRTRFYVNGQGNRFDYLFLYAQFVDEVIVDNFVGNYIYHNIACEGWANRIVGMNLGGRSPLLWGGNHGVINQIIGINLEVDIGVNPPFSLSRIQQAVAVNIDVKDKSPTLHLRHNARYGQVVCVDTKGLLHFLSSDNSLNTYPCINQMVYDNVSDITKNPSCRQLISINNYHTWLHHPLIMLFQKARIQRTIDLARSLKNAPYPQVLAIADELYALRPKVSERFYKRYDGMGQGLKNIERQLCNGI